MAQKGDPALVFAATGNGIHVSCLPGRAEPVGDRLGSSTFAQLLTRAPAAGITTT